MVTLKKYVPQQGEVEMGPRSMKGRDLKMGGDQSWNQFENLGVRCGSGMDHEEKRP